MKLNPILQKELKMGSRTIKLPIILILYNLILSCVAILLLSSVQTQLERGFGLLYDELISIFYILGWIQFVIVCFMIPIVTASSIAGERERQTLDMMLTTSISPLKIVIGKLTASMCTICLLVVSSIPILSIAFLLGGMDWGVVLYFIAILIIVGIFVGSIGIFFSSLIKKTPTAIVLTFLVGGILMIGTVLLFPFIKILYQNFAYSAISDGVPEFDIRWASLLMLWNPAILFADFMQKSSGREGITSYMVDLFGCTPNGRLVTFADHWWIAISIVLQLSLTIFFLWGATRALDPQKSSYTRNTNVKNKE